VSCLRLVRPNPSLVSDIQQQDTATPPLLRGGHQKHLPHNSVTTIEDLFSRPEGKTLPARLESRLESTLAAKLMIVLGTARPHEYLAFDVTPH
jgi:hypothetical protein